MKFTKMSNSQQVDSHSIRVIQQLLQRVQQKSIKSVLECYCYNVQVINIKSIIINIIGIYKMWYKIRIYTSQIYVHYYEFYYF